MPLFPNAKRPVTNELSLYQDLCVFDLQWRALEQLSSASDPFLQLDGLLL